MINVLWLVLAVILILAVGVGLWLELSAVLWPSDKTPAPVADKDSKLL